MKSSSIKANVISDSLNYIAENDLKINGVFILMGYPNIAFEHLINKKIGVGCAIYHNANDGNKILPKNMFIINSRYYLKNSYQIGNPFFEIAFSSFKFKYKERSFSIFKPHITKDKYYTIYYSQIISAGIGYKSNLYKNMVFSEINISGGIGFYEGTIFPIFPARFGISIGARF